MVWVGERRCLESRWRIRELYHPNDLLKTLGNKGHRLENNGRGICRRKVQSRRGTNQIVVMVKYQVLISHRDDKVKYHVLNNPQDNNVVKYQVRVNQRNDEVMHRVRRHHQDRRSREAMPRIHRNLVDNRVPHPLGRARDTLGRVRELQKSIRFIPRWVQKHLERSEKFRSQPFLSQMFSVKLKLEVVRDVHRE